MRSHLYDVCKLNTKSDQYNKLGDNAGWKMKTTLSQSTVNNGITAVNTYTQG